MSLHEFSEAPAQPPAGEKRARVRAQGLALEPHVCRACFGRIASEPHADGQRRYFCTNCGLEGVGSKPSVVCSCGMKQRKVKGDGRAGVAMVDMGVRCHPNKRKSPEFPALFVASYGGAQAET
jgi:hypothetical protein